MQGMAVCPLCNISPNIKVTQYAKVFRFWEIKIYLSLYHFGSVLISMYQLKGKKTHHQLHWPPPKQRSRKADFIIYPSNKKIFLFEPCWIYRNPTLPQHIPFMMNWILHILSCVSTKALVTFGNVHWVSSVMLSLAWGFCCCYLSIKVPSFCPMLRET